MPLSYKILQSWGMMGVLEVFNSSLSPQCNGLPYCPWLINFKWEWRRVGIASFNTWWSTPFYWRSTQLRRSFTLIQDSIPICPTLLVPLFPSFKPLTQSPLAVPTDDFLNIWKSQLLLFLLFHVKFSPATFLQCFCTGYGFQIHQSSGWTSSILQWILCKCVIGSGHVNGFKVMKWPHIHLFITFCSISFCISICFTCLKMLVVSKGRQAE